MRTQQDDHAEQNGHQGGGAEAWGEEQSLHAAGAQVPCAVAAAHVYGQCAGAALDGIVAVRDDDGQVVCAHLLPVKATPPG